MADGKATRFNGAFKHLLKVDGEAIIARAVRLLYKYGAEDITICSRHQQYTYAPRKKYPDNVEEIDKFYSSREDWEGTCVFVYGDVFFSEEAIKTITSYEGKNIEFFGRPLPSKITGGKHGEIFAVYVPEAKHKEFKEACAFIRQGVQSGSVKRGGAWELYRHLQGIGLNNHIVTTNMTIIDDWTDDFDYLEDYKVFMKRWNSK